MTANGTNGVHTPMSAATKLRRMIEDPNGFVAAPGVHDGLSARTVLEQGGFDCLYMTGAGTTASRLGTADLGIATINDMRAHAEMIANLDPSIPLIADMDTGYGGPVMVARSVEAYARSGVAGFHIEDQVQQKRCGHLLGKQLVDEETYVSRIRAAVAARKRIGSDIVIIARTDALQSLGYDAAIQRLKAARDAGADVAFLEGMTDKEMCRRAVKDLAPWPSLLNMVEYGVTPIISADEAKEMGFKVIIWPFATVVPAYVAMRDAIKGLKKTGVQNTPEGIGPRKIFEVCGLEGYMAFDAETGGTMYAKGA
ncbi:uncharacterized protein PV09_07540 [Verruconis gallopava]|uniref:Methylisocitrate lyase n=1 Tax=Verruconis gallopava TaxID=253628 RepID=A0A0D2APH5_9PEZI|nr:uncharacterized protein PV09_07540 [Verruconis gallopava]KIW01024.1 hypothetical protein PV09_07540 [Verruconis gallopava]